MDLRQVITGSRPTVATAAAGQDPNNPNSITLPSPKPKMARYKPLIIDAIALIAAAGFGYAYYGYVALGYSIIILLVALTVFAACFSLQVFVVQRTGRGILATFLESLAVVGFFWKTDIRILLVTWAVVFVFLLWGYWDGRRRLDNSITIPFFGATGVLLGKFTTGVLIFMILIYAPNVSGNPIVISQKGFGTIFDWASNAVNDFYPNISLHGSFGNFSESVVRMELAHNPSFQSLSPAQQSAVVSQQTKQFETDFLGNASSSVAASSSASDAFYNVIQGMANAWKAEAGGWFVVGWIAVVFIALRSIGVVFNMIAQFITLLFYELLLATGFMKVHEEEHIREVISL